MEDLIKIFIKRPSSSKKVLKIDINATIKHLKDKVNDLLSINVDFLIFGKLTLSNDYNDRTLWSWGIRNKWILYTASRLCGKKITRMSLNNQVQICNYNWFD